MPTTRRKGIVSAGPMIAVLVGILTIGLSSAAAQVSPVNLSGYEIYLGNPCLLDSVAGTCNVTFTGWTGGSGAVANGWVRFPGDRQGGWAIQINYTGSPGFGSIVTIHSGKWKLAFRNRTIFFGTVLGGSVQWPLDTTDDLGCGPGIAVVDADLGFAGSSYTSAADGCLHDLPAGTVIPPRIWGTFFSTP